MNIYRFYIELQGIRPPIWRLIDVPSGYTFWQFHVAIQNAMGWEDYHLHHFEIKNPKTGRIDYIGYVEYDIDLEYVENMLSERDVKIEDYFSRDNPSARYVYDYGDGWIHTIKLEAILPAEETTGYPRCIDGQRACPPEDCGGPPGYMQLCKIIRDPSHEDYQNILQWLGSDFDPEYFRPEEIEFDDPEERWKRYHNP